MKYPRLYTSLEEFERLELGTSNQDWSAGQFFEDVLEDYATYEYEDEEEEE